MKKILILITMIMLLLSCGKTENNNGGDKKVVNDVKIIKNSLEPADPNLKIVPKLVLSISDIADDGTENFQRLQQISVSDDGNIYVSDGGTFSIRKFDSSGKLLANFGKQGNGPGEFSMISAGIAAGVDRIYIPDPMTQTVNIFDNTGVFIEKVNTMAIGVGMITMPSVMENGDFISYVTQVEQKDSKIILKNSLKILGDKFSEKSQIWSLDVSFDPTDISAMMSMGNDFPALAFSKEEVFVSKSGVDRFEITAYDLSGKEKYKIQLPYRKLKYSQKELDLINEKMKSFGDDNVKQYMKEFKFEETFKRVISAMYVDGKDRLWVAKANEIAENDDVELVKLDIFKDGIYQNTIELKDSDGNLIGGMIQVKGNKIYSLDQDDNNINVYEF
ncbi:MAG: hypothetical protein GQ534_03790 [Candidatus Delongbacteria bacterium]|nr:hypothetical protein [Candidatus Delongbacteria bacterium]